MDRRVQLLVHAGASSSRKDDERYAAQAAAYLELEPSRVSKIMSFRSTDAANNAPSSSQQSQRKECLPDNDMTLFPQTPVPDSFGPDLYIEDTQLAYTALESQLFTTSPVVRATPTTKSSGGAATDKSRRPTSGDADIRSSGEEGDQNPHQAPQNGTHTFGVKRRAMDDLESSGSRPSSESEPASQSSRLGSPMLLRYPKRMRLNGTTSSSSQPNNQSSKSGRIVPSSSRVPPWTVSKFIQSAGNQDSAEGTVTTDETTSELPASYSLSDVPSDSLKDRSELLERSISEPGPSINSLDGSPNQEPDSQSRSQSSPAKSPVKSPTRTRFQDKKLCDNIQQQSHQRQLNEVGFQTKQPVIAETFIRSTTTREAANAALARDTAAGEAARLKLQGLSLEIRPHNAITSMNVFKTHITKMLRDIAENRAVAHKFEPISVQRELDVHERGHWLMNWSPWTATQKLYLWEELEAYIGNGNAGWGVWCTRGADEKCDDDHSRTVTQSTADGSVTENDSTTFANVRVYCWGEIVKHVYLLLYTLSSGRVRKLGLQWIDAEAKVVVQMRGAASVPSM